MNCRHLAKALKDDVDGVDVDLNLVHTNMFSVVLDPRITKKKKGKASASHSEFAGILNEKYGIMMMPSF